MSAVILSRLRGRISSILVRRSKEDKAASHERILSAAASRIRERGTDQAGVAEIMRAAGLTHGGFYKHFDSREELIEEAVGRALTENEPTVGRMVQEADDPLAWFADWYVSAAHRDDPAAGCGVVALGADVRRVGGAAQEAYRAQVDRYLSLLQSLLEGDDEDTRRRASVTLSAMVGAVMIARALGPTPRSDELLRDVREAVRDRRLLAD
jgi:TetR/AcrR family transcriptional regulator, transcriptional repressor for nem operon